MKAQPRIDELQQRADEIHQADRAEEANQIVFEPNTWRDVAVTEREIKLLRELLAHLTSQPMWLSDRGDEILVLTQVVERWDANYATERWDATEFTA